MPYNADMISTNNDLIAGFLYTEQLFLVHKCLQRLVMSVKTQSTEIQWIATFP